MGLEIIAIVITFYLPSCLGQETVKGPFGFRVKLSPAHLSITLGGGFTRSLLMLNVKQKAVNTNFYSPWFDPTGNRTHVYRFSSRRFIRLNTGPLNDVIHTAKQFREQSLKFYNFCENKITAHM